MKRYLCIWDKDVFEIENNFIETHYLDFFTKENGYDESEIYTISNMSVGEVYSIPSSGEAHTVVRIID